MPKRILMLLENNCFPHDTRVMLEANSLAEAGYQVTVVSPTGESKAWAETVGEVRVYRYPAPFESGGVVGYLLEYGYSLMAAFLYSWLILLRHGFDVIHVHAPPDMNAMVARFFQLLGKKFVYDMHDLSPELLMAQRNGQRSGLLYRGLCFFERFACQRADRLIATNETQRSIQIKRGGARKESCFTVRNGPNQRFLSEVAPDTSLQRDGKLILGYVGLMGYQDGVDHLILALQHLRDAFGEKEFYCYVVGDGPAKQDLLELTRKLGLDDQVRFTGLVQFSEVPRYIAAFDICLTPDPSNPYNDSCTTIKTMEYMALGKPTVCYRTHENELTAGNSALYAENNDPVELSRAILRLMNDSSLRSQMGGRARNRIEAGLTWQHQSQNLLAVYADLWH